VQLDRDLMRPKAFRDQQPQALFFLWRPRLYAIPQFHLAFALSPISTSRRMVPQRQGARKREVVGESSVIQRCDNPAPPLWYRAVLHLLEHLLTLAAHPPGREKFVGTHAYFRTQVFRSSGERFISRQDIR
jgi:hypothetical protein